MDSSGKVVFPSISTHGKRYAEPHLSNEREQHFQRNPKGFSRERLLT
jgi:hypothetical protein